MALLNTSFYSMNIRTLDVNPGSTTQVKNVNTGTEEPAETPTLVSGTRVSEEDFNMNYDKYKGRWIYYVQPNGVAHAKFINKWGVASDVKFCSPEKADKL